MLDVSCLHASQALQRYYIYVLRASCRWWQFQKRVWVLKSQSSWNIVYEIYIHIYIFVKVWTRYFVWILKVTSAFKFYFMNWKIWFTDRYEHYNIGRHIKTGQFGMHFNCLLHCGWAWLVSPMEQPLFAFGLAFIFALCLKACLSPEGDPNTNTILLLLVSHILFSGDKPNL